MKVLIGGLLGGLMSGGCFYVGYRLGWKDGADWMTKFVNGGPVFE